MTDDKLKSVASSILHDEGQELINAADRISSSVVEACDLIVKHPGKVVICGMGKWDNDMFESKCGSSGETFRIEHRSDQLNNPVVFYGKPTRFYK